MKPVAWVWCAGNGGRCGVVGESYSSGDLPEGWGRTAEGLRACPAHAVAPPAESDAINHPSHYTMGGIEVIDAIEAWDLGFRTGNVVKYVARAKHKGRELEDLKKAEFYLRREIEALEGESR